MGQPCQRRLLPVPKALGAFAGGRDKYGEQKSKRKRNMQAAALEQRRLSTAAKPSRRGCAAL